MDDRERHEQGMKVRRAVLGDAHVDRATRNRNEFNEAFQDLITRYAWGEIWSRPGLPRETRSLITLAMMVALNRPDELRMHIRAAFNVGVTREQSTAAFRPPIPPFTPLRKSLPSSTPRAHPSPEHYALVHIPASHG
jgi:4-carboxymuconolactone decarboxylase